MTSATRIAVGEPNGRRSTIWKFWVHKNEAYILSRMFGQDAKVSFHSSGQCQWSATDTWIRREAGRRNRERHIVKWTVSQPRSSEAIHLFRVFVPESELCDSKRVEDVSMIHWLPAPKRQHAISIDCYITPPIPTNASLLSPPNVRRPFSLPFADGRQFVGIEGIVAFDDVAVEALRSELTERVRSAGIEPNHRHRACAFTTDSNGVRGLVELRLL